MSLLARLDFGNYLRRDLDNMYRVRRKKIYSRGR